jgi:hypothetical protein
MMDHLIAKAFASIDIEALLMKMSGGIDVGGAIRQVQQTVGDIGAHIGAIHLNTQTIGARLDMIDQRQAEHAAMLRDILTAVRGTATEGTGP